MLAVATAEPTRISGLVSMPEPDVCAPIDANGNLTSDGTRTFEWDARNQLLAVNVGTHRSEFTYDGEKRRVRVVEKENSVVQSDNNVLWCNTAVCEERETGGSVVRRAFSHADSIAGEAKYIVADHLGSPVALTGSSGSAVATYAYDAWGRATVTGSAEGVAGFTGHLKEGNSGTLLTLHRAYDPELGRWISEDPIGLKAGPNFYTYVLGRPTVLWDPLGLQGECCAELEQRRRRLHEILDSIEQNREIDSQGPMGVTACYGGPGGWEGSYSVMPHTPPCLVPCVIAHEEVHVRQCRRYGPMGGRGERTAYMIELGCVIRRLRSQNCDC